MDRKTESNDRIWGKAWKTNSVPLVQKASHWQLTVPILSTVKVNLMMAGLPHPAWLILNDGLFHWPT